ncbi:endo-1,4-beta-xylanase [Vibrio variabilis]|uniref:endo-1,4-beta-xylanase n=1 Tax=Vibrio variabilis TaxID=990271 RepID=UPI000DD6C04A|nr:endo-1,4-beta-xylanase [Vibrio variabilis]
MKNLVATSLFAVCAIMPVFAVQGSDLPTPSLKELAKQSGIYVGAAMEARHLKEPEFAKVFASQFNQLTPENEMKWSYIHPERNRFDFAKADELVAFAEQHNMAVKGHALVWHIQNPEWLTNQDWTAPELEKVLERHIKTVVGHYKGKVKYWDVVNESFNENGSYRETLWYQVLGERYLELAFKFAHQADPDAILFYNDYSNEGMGPKSNAIYRKVKGMVDEGIPIHGVGFQLHLMGEHSIGEATVARNIQRLQDLGLKVHFTEVDVRIRDDAKQFSVDAQARLFSRLMDFAIYYPSVDMYTTWGVTDKYSWIPSWFPGYGRGLMFDKDYKPKKAFDAVYSSLLAASQGEFAYQPPVGEHADTRIVQAFVAKPLTQSRLNDQEVIYYPFAYNQLGGQNLAVPESHNLSGKWAVGYHDNKLIGRVYRQDDKTFTNKTFDYENDNVEVFLQSGEAYWQIRSVVGEDFAANSFPGKTKGVWSADGKVFDFEIEFTSLKSLTGETIGFNIALSDNDEPEADASVMLSCILYLATTPVGKVNSSVSYL